MSLLKFSSRRSMLADLGVESPPDCANPERRRSTRVVSRVLPEVPQTNKPLQRKKEKPKAYVFEYERFPESLKSTMKRPEAKEKCRNGSVVYSPISTVYVVPPLDGWSEDTVRMPEDEMQTRNSRISTTDLQLTPKSRKRIEEDVEREGDLHFNIKIVFGDDHEPPIPNHKSYEELFPGRQCRQNSNNSSSSGSTKRKGRRRSAAPSVSERRRSVYKKSKDILTDSTEENGFQRDAASTSSEERNPTSEKIAESFPNARPRRRSFVMANTLMTVSSIIAEDDVSCADEANGLASDRTNFHQISYLSNKMDRDEAAENTESGEIKGLHSKERNLHLQSGGDHSERRDERKSRRRSRFFPAESEIPQVSNERKSRCRSRFVPSPQGPSISVIPETPNTDVHLETSHSEVVTQPNVTVSITYVDSRQSDNGTKTENSAIPLAARGVDSVLAEGCQPNQDETLATSSHALGIPHEGNLDEETRSIITDVAISPVEKLSLSDSIDDPKRFLVTTWLQNSENVVPSPSFAPSPVITKKVQQKLNESVNQRLHFNTTCSTEE